MGCDSESPVPPPPDALPTGAHGAPSGERRPVAPDGPIPERSPSASTRFRGESSGNLIKKAATQIGHIDALPSQDFDKPTADQAIAFVKSQGETSLVSAAASAIGLEPPLAAASPPQQGGSTPTLPVSSPSVAAIPDVERRRRPAQFFKPFPSPADQADPMEPVIFDADADFMEAVHALVTEAQEQVGKIGTPGLFFSPPEGKGWFGALQGFRDGEALGVASVAKTKPLLVIGDVHGDIVSLAAALQLATEPATLHRMGLLPSEERPAVVLLGDLVDRGVQHVECVLLYLNHHRKYATDTIWVVGNHDIGHQWSDKSDRFVADLEPAEFTDWLNGGEGEEHKARVRFGRAYDAHVRKQPRAVAFASGLLAVHGGVPHCDLFHQFQTLTDLKGSDRAKDDFTWIRVAESAPKKYPNRSRRGCEIGTEQLVASVEHISMLLEAAGHAPVNAVVRGHDHYPERFFVHRAGFPPMSLVTINTMGAEPDGARLHSNEAVEPCVGVYVHGRAPRIVRIRALKKDGMPSSSIAGGAPSGLNPVNRCTRD